MMLFYNIDTGNPAAFYSYTSLGALLPKTLPTVNKKSSHGDKSGSWASGTLVGFRGSLEA
jgi:hypothetical protein